MNQTVEEILANVDWKRNVGKFKVGDIISGCEKGFWKIVEIDRRKGFSESGEAHVVAFYNPETKKSGKPKFSWCCHYSKPVSEEVKRQRDILQKQMDKLEKQAKALGL